MAQSAREDDSRLEGSAREMLKASTQAIRTSAENGLVSVGFDLNQRAAPDGAVGTA
jgi:hypothetical protein